MKKFLAALIVFAIVLASVTVKAASADAPAPASAWAPASAMASADASAKPAKKHKKAKKLVNVLSGVVAVVKEGEVIKSITVTPAGDEAVAIVLNDAGKALAAKVGQVVTVKGKVNAATEMFEVLQQADTAGAEASMAK